MWHTFLEEEPSFPLLIYTAWHHVVDDGNWTVHQIFWKLFLPVSSTLYFVAICSKDYMVGLLHNAITCLSLLFGFPDYVL